jgi:2-oxoglutarate dehydrogenase E2 component (dihydrolipoamide succinyltransferase)
MPVELKVPEVGESITEVQIGEWLKAEGDWVERDEVVVTLDTDKATVELPATVSGTLTKILKQAGEPAQVGEIIGHLEEGEVPASEETEKVEPERPAKEMATVREPASETVATEKSETTGRVVETAGIPPRVMPAAQRALAEHGLQTTDVEATGPGGRVLKEDVLRRVEQHEKESIPKPSAGPSDGSSPRHEEAVRMTPLRRKVAERLVQAQQQAALLTTFNEIDMSSVMALRTKHRDDFQERYGVKLGFMSFFVKAVIDALTQVPQLNAEIRGDEIVYRNHYDIGIAVGSEKGLVVPVLLNAERMSFAEIEIAIADFGKRAKENKLKLEELQGGTFTISNGGVYGSLLSTPIVNPPQSGVLGMHSIEKRPVARDDQVVIRPMMYVALTYDHRIVDGREAVTFLRRIKECIESPSRMLLEV